MMKRKNRKAFSIVEVMAALIIIGLLSAIVATNFLGQTDKARQKQTVANLRVLHMSVSQFKMDTGRFPSADEGLIVLVEEPADAEGWNPGGYLQTSELPLDGWGNEFFYQEYPEDGKPFTIISFGADGEPGGEGYDEDLYSTRVYR